MMLADSSLIRGLIISSFIGIEGLINLTLLNFYKKDYGRLYWQERREKYLAVVEKYETDNGLDLKSYKEKIDEAFNVRNKMAHWHADFTAKAMIEYTNEKDEKFRCLRFVNSEILSSINPVEYKLTRAKTKALTDRISSCLKMCRTICDAY